MVLHARILYVVLQSSLQLCQLLLSGRVDVVSVPIVRHLDVLEGMIGCNLLVLCGEAHTRALTGGHCEGRKIGRMGPRLLHTDARCAGVVGWWIVLCEEPIHRLYPRCSRGKARNSDVTV
jgi:hypothetical protein